MHPVLAYTLLGYLSGSLLFARLLIPLFRPGSSPEQSPDGNPGAANAFRLGGPLCGALTLTGDILKGFLPVFLFMHRFGPETAPLLCAPVIAAPVAGHTFPVFRHFRGGKGIAVTFGCLLGLMPNLMPFLLFAGSFILFSTVIVITPHFQRTLAAYALTLGLLLCGEQPAGIAGGFLLIAVLTSIRFHKSPEIRETMAVRLFRRAS